MRQIKPKAKWSNAFKRGYAAGARKARGFFADLTDEQMQKVLAYQGSETFGDDKYRRPKVDVLADGTERIAAAAVFNGMTVSLPPPARHHTIIQTLDRNGFDGASIAPFLQGFVTSRGRYVNRIEAFYIASAAKQIISGSKGPELYSEDLW